MSIEKDIIKEFGEGIIRSGSAVVDSELLTIPVSPSLDVVLGGGIPEGSFVTFTVVSFAKMVAMYIFLI